VEREFGNWRWRDKCQPDVNLCAQHPLGLLVGALDVVGTVDTGDVKRGKEWVS